MRIFGIPILIDRSWYFTALLITWALATGDFPMQLPGHPAAVYWILGALTAVLLFSCVLLHELGHSFVARAFGIPVHRVTLFIFGGVASIGQEARRPLVEFLVAFAGPLVSLGIALALRAVLQAAPSQPEAVGFVLILLIYLIRVNIGILLFNLLPGFPLDGGRVLRALLWMITGSFVRATRIASAAGIVLGLGLIGLGGWTILARQGWSGGLWAILLGAYLQSTANAVFRQTRAIA